MPPPQTVSAPRDPATRQGIGWRALEPLKESSYRRKNRMDAGEPTGIIFDIKRYAIHDGPGIRTTVFFKGCPLHCLWCHNPESWDPRPEHSHRPGQCIRCGRCLEACGHEALAEENCLLCGECAEACPTEARELVGRTVTASELMSEIERDRLFFDHSGGGVTFSGGEPLAQHRFLGVILAICRKQGIHTALDTSCFADPEVLRSINGNVDLYLVDFKHSDPAAHERFTGESNALILENLRWLALEGRQVVVRIPVIPGVNDTETQIRKMGRLLTSVGPFHRVDLLPHHESVRGKLSRLSGRFRLFEAPAIDDQKMESLAEVLRTTGFTVTIGG